jgi:hypothetical protein
MCLESYFFNKFLGILAEAAFLVVRKINFTLISDSHERHMRPGKVNKVSIFFCMEKFGLIKLF